MTRPKLRPGHKCTVAAGQHQRVALPLHSNRTAQLLLGAGDAEFGRGTAQVYDRFRTKSTA